MLVTGASSGIGAAVARMAMDRGWTVGLMARRADALRAVAGDRGVVLPGDVTRRADAEAAVADLLRVAGRVDVLFNNAGIFTPRAEIDAMAVEDWDRALAVNLSGMVWMARAVWPLFRRQAAGRIVNNGSVSAHAPRPGALPYTVTKHAVTGLTRQLALDGRAHGIACGQIDIGNAATPLLSDVAAQSDGPVPMMDVDDAARAVLAMAELPPEANVLFQTIMATGMPFVGRG